MIEDYLLRLPTFEAPRPCNFDEHYVVKGISQFFDACDFLDRWVNDSSSSDLLSDSSPAKLMSKPFHALSTPIVSIEFDNHCHVREFYPVKEVVLKSLVNSMLTDCAQPIEGVAFTADRISCQSVTPLEGVCSFGIRTNELINHAREINLV